MSNKLLEKAQKDLDGILKCASPQERTANTLNLLKHIATPLLSALAVMGTSGAAAYYFSKKDKDQHQNDLANSMKLLSVKNPEFSKSPGQFIERFNELTHLSPTIAKNPTLAARLLTDKLHSGFDVDDIHKLTTIENNTSTSRGGFHPGNAARAAASSSLSTLATTFGPDVLRDFRGHANEYKSRLSAIAKKESELTMPKSKPSGFDEEVAARAARYSGLDKQSSAPRTVSDGCLGTMLAERYTMFKTAGLMENVGIGAKNLAKSLSVFAPAIALGGGLELMKHVMESRKNAALGDQADKEFKNLLRTSDIVKGDTATAYEAFNTLKAFAPSLAVRPLVLKTFVENTVNNSGHITSQMVQDFASTENQIRGFGGKSDFMGGIKSITGLQHKPSELQAMGLTPAKAKDRF